MLASRSHGKSIAVAIPGFVCRCRTQPSSMPNVFLVDHNELRRRAAAAFGAATAYAMYQEEQIRKLGFDPTADIMEATAHLDIGARLDALIAYMKISMSTAAPYDADCGSVRACREGAALGLAVHEALSE